MNNNKVNGHASLQNGSDEDFEFMNEMPKEDPVIIERRRIRNNEITKKLGAYLLKGYCMLSDSCPECDCILLRTPDRELLCVGCSEVDAASNNKETKVASPTTATTATPKGENEQRLTSAESTDKNKDRVRRTKKRSKKISSTHEGDNTLNDNKTYSIHLENKLKWAVDELSKSQNPNRINAMCTVIIKLTESIKALKEYETTSA